MLYLRIIKMYIDVYIYIYISCIYSEVYVLPAYNRYIDRERERFYLYIIYMLYLSNQVDGIDGMETETFRLIRSSA